MTRRRKSQPPASAADLGSDALRERGQIVIVDTPDSGEGADPNRTIRRARRYDPLLEMQGLDMALFIAAERFRDCYALVEGARDGISGSRLEPWQRCHYAVRVADARAEVQGSLQAVGLRLSAVFVGAVIQYQRLRSIERDLGMRHGSASDLVRAALELLRDYQSGMAH